MRIHANTDPDPQQCMIKKTQCGGRIYEDAEQKSTSIINLCK
jgi:hypothetical protein